MYEPNLAILINALNATSQITSEEWLSRLSQRKLDEIKFHDIDRERLRNAKTIQERESTSSNRKYYSVTRAQNTYIKDWLLQNTKEMVFLDYACGSGRMACEYAANSKLSIGIDISKVSIELAKIHALEANVSNKTYFLQGDCENTGLPDNQIDVILCSGMLHHLDLSYALPELRRILKPGGKILAIEALNYNPVIKAYRYLTPNLRTDWEKRHILSLSDLRFARRFFHVSEIKYWNLAVLLGTPFRRSRYFSHILSAFEKCDSILLKIPGIAQLAWSFTFVMTKR